MCAWLPRVLILPASMEAWQRTIGGGERYALEYARALGRKVPVTHGLFDLNESERKSEPITERVFSLRHRSFRWGFPATWRTWRALAEFDVIHIMCFPTSLSDALVPLARLRRQIVVLTDVGGGGRCWSGYLKKIHPRWDLHRWAHGLAHLSRYAGSFYRNWSQPQTVLFGGTGARTALPASPGGYALFVGRLLPHKGILNLIHAIGPAMPLRVVGRPYAPEYYQELRQAAVGKQVTFITDASDDDLAREYAGASVVLQPSLPTVGRGDDKSELLGLVGLEGMAAGKPVIVTRVTSLPELVVDGETGFIVAPRDLIALRAKIQLLLDNPELVEAMGRRAREHVQAHFTWTAAAERGLDFYRALAVRHGIIKPSEAAS